MGVEAFISRWSGRKGGAERANYALFLTELTAALGLPPPEPADSASGYRFEYPVRGNAGQPLRIDLYKKGCFILEAKQSRLTADKGEAIIVQEDILTRAGRHGLKRSSSSAIRRSPAARTFAPSRATPMSRRCGG